MISSIIYFHKNSSNHLCTYGIVAACGLQEPYDPLVSAHHKVSAPLLLLLPPLHQLGGREAGQVAGIAPQHDRYVAEGLLQGRPQHPLHWVTAPHLQLTLMLTEIYLDFWTSAAAYSRGTVEYVWHFGLIRIWICRSIPLTNGSVFGSGTCSESRTGFGSSDPAIFVIDLQDAN